MNNSGEIKNVTNTTVVEDMYKKESRYSAVAWVKKAVNKYSDFKGRARRKEYWLFFIAAALLNIIALVCDLAIIGFTEYQTYYGLYIAASLLSITPLLAAGSRRLHDIGRTGWWQLLWVIPFLLCVVALVIANMYAIKSDIKPEDVVSIEATAIATSFVIGGWLVITTLLLINTSPRMNQYGIPAKPLGKRELFEQRKRSDILNIDKAGKSVN